MPAQLFRKALIVCVAAAALAAPVSAQQQQAPQAPPTPAPTQPNTTPQPRQPTPTPAPQTFPQNQNINIRGRIIAQSLSSFPMIEVRLETDGGQPVGFGYTDNNGEFRIQVSGFSSDQTMYLVIQLDGFKPYRERIGGPFGMSSIDSLNTIFLERENTVKANGSAGTVVDLKQLRAKIPGKAVDEYEKAIKESSKGNREKAVEGLLRAVKLAPDFYEAHHTLGVQYLGLHNYSEAETSLLRARDLSPKAAEPLINLGTLYYQRGESQSDAGQTEEAIVTFKKATEFLDESIRRNPLSADAHSYLGAALYKIASYERAESVLQRALDLDGDLSNARLMLINVYTKQSRFNEALGQTNLFLTKYPKAPQRPAIEQIKKQIEKVLAQPKPR